MNFSHLKDTFIALVSKYESNQHLCEKLWIEVLQAHSQSNRHYHGINHLNHLLEEITIIESEIINRDVVLFCLFYHDLIYKVTKSNNEAKSAEIAKTRMNQLSIPHPLISICTDMIIATKHHKLSDNQDTNIFLDADLSILGAEWPLYKSYYNNVRKEFSIYPTFIYNKGRKKVLNHFLTMSSIFKTKHFANKYESSARENLKRELALI